MSKRIFSIVLSLAMLCSAVCITGILSVSAAGELREGGRVIATYAAVTGPEDIPADTQLNLGKVAFRYDRAAGYNFQSNGNASQTKSMDQWNSNDLPNQNSSNSGLQWPGMSRRDIDLLMADGNYLSQYREVTEAQTNGTANIAIPWKSGSYWETDASGNAVTDYAQATFAGWANSDDSQYLVYDLGDTYSVGKIGIGSGVERPTMTAANAPGSVEELQALMGQAKNASRALTKVSVYVGNDLATLFGTPNTGSDGKTTFSGDACRVMTYDLSSTPEQALANIFSLTEAAQGRYVGFYFHYNGIPYISELAVYGSQGSSAPIELGDSYGTTYQPLTATEQVPERTSLIAGKQPLNGTLAGSEGTAAAVTDGKFAGLHVFADYKTTTSATDSKGASDPVPGEDGLYFDYGGSKWPQATVKSIRSVYSTSAPAGGPHFDTLYPLTFDLGSVCTIDSLAIGSTADPGSWVRGNPPRTVAEYTAKKQSYDKDSYLLKGEVYISDSRETLYDAANRVMYYDWSASADRSKALNNLFTLQEAKTGRYVGFKFNTREKFIRVGELAVYGSQGSSAPIALGDSYGTTYQPLTAVEQVPERTSLIAGKQPLNGTLIGSEGTATAVTDGNFAGLHVFADYKTTTSATDSKGASDPVPGEDGLYFDSGGSNWPQATVKSIRSVYFTDAPAGGPHFDTLYPLTFDLGSVCTIDSLAIGSTADPGSWVRGNPPRTVAEYAARKQSYDKDSYLLKGEVYISNSRENLYDAANRVMYYDWSASGDRSKALNNLFTLQEAKTGRYVGFKFNTRERLIRVGELAVYGESDRSVIQLTSANVNELTKLGANRLQDAERLSGTLANGSGTWDCLSDGIIYGITTNDAAYKTSKCGMIVNGADKKNPVTGEDIAGISGWGSVKFKLAVKTTLTHVLMAGSGADEGNNRYVRYYEFYASDTQEDLFTEENRIVRYDNTADPQLAQIHVLQEAVSCRYVGVRFTGEAYEQARISEIGLYGEADRGVIQLTSANVNELTKLGENRLQGAERLSGTLANGSGTWDCLSDGIIYGITTNDAAYKTSKCGIIVSDTDKKNPVTGEDIAGISGWGSATFKLGGKATLTHVLMVGSGADEGNNRYVRYYEFYASDTQGDLFTEENRIVRYDNTADPQLAQIHALQEAVSCRYVGVRFTGEAYSQARISEIGLYGDMAMAAQLPYTSLGTQADYETALAGKGSNLLKGEQVGNKTHDYLDAVGMAIVGGQVAWLTDGYINWTGAETEEKLQLKDASSNNSNHFYYDLRGTVKLDSVLVAASGKDEPAYRPDRISLYLSDDPETLFTDDTLLGQVLTGGSSVAVLIRLAGMEATGRYIGFSIPGDTQWNVLRLTELGVYGTYTTAVEPLALNLLCQPNSKRVDHFQVDARGIDNVTAVGANGVPGTNGNTGNMPSKRSVRFFENLDNLTDGDWSTRSAQLSDTKPEALDQNILNYDNSWIGISYYLGGGAKLDTVSLVSSNEPYYYVTGVQIYASYYYKDLFKNESLLYTTGGEHYVGNEEDGYLPDVAYEVNQRELKYELTDAQKAQEYRYLAFVVTRNFPLYVKGTNRFQLGYGLARIAELTAYGDIATPEEPIQSSWEVSTSLGTATVMVEPKNYDDREFYAQIARVTIDEEKLPDSVPRHINNNWLTVAKEKVFHLRFWDASGNQIRGEGKDRDVMVVFPIDHQNNLFAGIIRDGQIQRLYNAYVRPDNTLRAGEINYPIYPDTEKNNRDKATYQDMDVSLVLLRWNDPRTVDTLNDNVHYGSVSEVFGTAVAGASTRRSAFPEESRSVSALWLLVPAGLAAAVLAGVWLLRRRQRGKAQQ